MKLKPWMIVVSFDKRRPVKTIVWANTKEDARILGTASYPGAHVSNPKKVNVNELVRSTDEQSFRSSAKLD